MNDNFGRPALSELAPYEVLYDAEVFADKGAIKLDANEMRFHRDISDLSSSGTESIKLQQYPDPKATLLIDALARYHSIPESAISVGNGSDDILRNICIAFFGARVAIPMHTYPVYQHLARMCEMPIDLLPMDLNFNLATEGCRKQFDEKRPQLALISYPNNPTGNCFSREFILELIDTYPQTVFVIDEAYAEFSGVTFLAEALERDNIIVVRTLSKAFGLANIRLGYAVAGAKLCQLIAKVQIPYPLSGLCQHIAARALSDSAYVENSMRNMAQLRSDLRARLECARLTVYQSVTNFLFVKIPPPYSSTALCSVLAEQKIYIRGFDYGCLGSFVRITVGTSSENKRVADCIREFISNVVLANHSVLHTESPSHK